MSTIIDQHAEPIPGYTLVELIGVGAYGEVWRAEAPGGMLKAIKFVHGFHTEGRAMRELKSLQTIKQLRHPFLLSLERFEIADGRLVIVMELADGSLKDRFLEYREAGAAGIPRQELLNHLRDAADALDFINETQSLQHLDVKAENLLLVGGRLKLGDFGLIQNLADDSSSLIEGMTPRYAAPELFKGRPTKFSDQFSLAIVYTKLLTGEGPFDAKSTADVAMQHLLGAPPKLDGLPAADRPAVLRALSRNPEERHPNCRSLIDALLGGPPAGHSPRHAAEQLVKTPGSPDRNAPDCDAADLASGAHPNDRQPDPAESLTDPVDPSHARSGQAAARSASQRKRSRANEDVTVVFSAETESRIRASYALGAATITRLPAVQVDDSLWEPRPTLFVGVGGVAGQLLRRLKRRLAERFEAHARIPAWGMLAIDTDENALEHVTAGEPVGALAPEDTLLINLRTTQEYREASPQILKWLSRRWLYNIPRTPKTCGWRPLGRLALADHGPRVMERLRGAIENVLAPESLASSAQTLGVELTGKPLIVLVASINGGSGSGMVLDLAYAIRKLAAEARAGEYTLRGVLLHSTEGDAASQDLARANAFACLSELAHFNRPGCGYPGEATLDLPAFPSVAPTFDETFLAHLGDDLHLTDFHDQLERVADSFYQELATRAGSILDDLRAVGRVQSNLAVRTFGLYAVDNLSRDTVDAFVDGLCQAVTVQWLGAGTGDDAAAARYTAFVQDEGFEANLRRQVERILGSGADTNFKSRLGDFLLSCYAPPEDKISDGDLSGLRKVLSELRDSLRAMARGRSLAGPSDEPGLSDRKGRSPLAGIRATVHAFVRERVLALAEALSRDVPESLFFRQRWQGQGEEVVVRALSELDGHLRTLARSEIQKALEQVDVTRMLLEMCGKSRAAREPMRELLAAATPRIGVDGAAERLFVFAPGYADREELREFFNEDMQQDAIVTHTLDSRLTLYCEREQMSLRDVAASLMEHRRGYADMAARLHTRSDVAWTPLPVDWPDES